MDEIFCNDSSETLLPGNGLSTIEEFLGFVRGGRLRPPFRHPPLPEVLAFPTEGRMGCS